MQKILRHLLQNILIVVLCTIFIFTPSDAFAQEKAVSVPDDIQYLERLEEGKKLLLRPKVGKVIYDFDIYALKKNNNLYYALADIIDVLDLSIDFNIAEKTGRGWFLREDWNIEIDLPNNKIISRGKNYTLNKEDIIEEDNVIFIAQKDIEQWFGFKFKPDIPQQFFAIESEYPLPAIAKNNRNNRLIRKNQSNNVAVLPRVQSDKKWFDMNTADVQLGTRMQRRESSTGDTTSQIRHSANVTAQGQILKHDAYIASNYDDFEGLSSVTARLSRREEDATLLGPLNARFYSLGDNNSTEIPLTGKSTQELGFRVTNNKLDTAQFQTTTIDGVAIPGWDIELYRNNILVESQQVSTSGQYEFAEVQLFNGDNDFEIFFYGPQGQVRSKQVSLPVTATLLETQNDIYDVSVSLSETQVYRKNKSQDEDAGTPHIAARYNKKIGDVLTYVGVRNRDVEGENKTLIASGFTSIYGDTLIDGNLGIDINNAAAEAELTARRSIEGWDFITTGRVESEDFALDGQSTPAQMKINTSTQKSFQPTPKTRLNLFSYGDYLITADNDMQSSSQIGGSYQMGNISISDSFNYDMIKPDNAPKDQSLKNILSVRANKGKFNIRGGLTYNILPEAEIDTYTAQLDYFPTSKFSSGISLRHKPNLNLSEARLNLNFTNEYFRTSPFLEIDSDNDLYAGVNLNFSVVDTPDSNLFEMTSKRLAGRGLVSSFVYYDKNGNMIFDEGDEILPDVEVESVNVRRRASTNERGYSLINDLPTNRATDIVLDKTTLPDSFMISAREGVSVLPNAGEITELQFPVHMAGEIDGTISLTNADAGAVSVKRAKINLYPLDKKEGDVIETQAAMDGFYVTSQIPPGRYLMSVDNETAAKNKAAAPAPKIITIGYEGDTIYGENIVLEAGKPNVPVQVSYLAKGENNQTREIYALKKQSKGRSKLSSLLSNFAEKKSGGNIYNGLKKVNFQTATTEGAPSLKSDTYYVLASNNMEATHAKCQELADRAIPCVLEVLIPTSTER